MNKPRKPDPGHIILVFDHQRTAKRAVHALLNAGVSSKRISFFARADPIEKQSDGDLEKACNRGGATGAGVGAIAGLALFAIPGIGPVLGAGRVAAALTGAILGGSIGGMGGALAGAGLSEMDAARAERHLRDGKSVIIVQTEDDQPMLSAIAHAQGSVEVANA